MPQNTILNGGLDELYTIKEYILELNGFEENNKELELKESNLEKEIEELKNTMNGQVYQMTKKRKEQLAKSFDQQIDTVRARIKKIAAKKEKSKNAKISQRIKEETADLTAENKQFDSEIKTLFKKNRIPFFCNSRFYYSLFCPKGIAEFLIALLFVFITLLLIPCGIYFLLLKEPKIWMLVAIYFIDIIIVAGGHMLIRHATLEKHRNEIDSARGIHNKIMANNKKIKAIRNAIMKDKDESPYNLEKYDKELFELDNKLSEIAQEKNMALKDFEANIRPTLEEEIRTPYLKDINIRKEQFDCVHKESLAAENKIKDLSLILAKDYGGYLGNDTLTLDKIDSLIEILEQKRANTIGEALNLQKQMSQ